MIKFNVTIQFQEFTTNLILQERKIKKRCRNGVPKSTQSLTRKDKSKYTKPHPSLHLFTKSKDVGIGLCIFTITFILPCLCTFWHVNQWTAGTVSSHM